jgi:hypothetical protein
MARSYAPRMPVTHTLLLDTRWSSFTIVDVLKRALEHVQPAAFRVHARHCRISACHLKDDDHLVRLPLADPNQGRWSSMSAYVASRVRRNRPCTGRYNRGRIFELCRAEGASGPVPSARDHDSVGPVRRTNVEDGHGMPALRPLKR